MSEEVVPTPLAIGGMGISYKIDFADGRALQFEVAVDATMAREDLDELLDRVGSAADRRSAVFELPLAKASLMSNRQMLKEHHRERDKARANMDASITIRSRGGRNSAEPRPADINAISQWDERIAKCQQAIKTAEIRIPYLEAIIAREDPPDLFPELKPNYREAAE